MTWCVQSVQWLTVGLTGPRAVHISRYFHHFAARKHTSVTVNMPRRSPPTPLRLVTGPLPMRNVPKHTLPSRPQPIFHSRAPAARTSRPRARSHSLDALPATDDGVADLGAHILVQMPSVWRLGHADAATDSAASSPVSSERGSEDGVRPVSPASATAATRVRRGPWDHSGSIKVPFDVETVLAPLRPAVLTVGLGR